ncbi:MAG: hypothetical protein LBR32_05420 [Propionibacteriaceae bacterium]|jgi:hypothetical protein|nr:hypothetical protein [Propionibacteriaceae bacterium]
MRSKPILFGAVAVVVVFVAAAVVLSFTVLREQPDVPTVPVQTVAVVPTATPGSYKAAQWANPINIGTPMWEATADGVTVALFFMGEDTSIADSHSVSDETGKPIVEKGDPIAYLNMVVTNNSDKTIYPARTGPEMWASTVDPEYAQSLTNVVPYSSKQWAAHGIYDEIERRDAGNVNKDGFGFPLAAGESFSIGGAVPLKYGRDFQFMPKVVLYPSADALMGSYVAPFDKIQLYTFPPA